MFNITLYRRAVLGALTFAAAVTVAPGLDRVAAQEPWPPPGVLRPGNGVSVPRLIYDPRPNYTSDAMRRRIQGRVSLEIVVDVTGTVTAARVVRSLDPDYGLDAEALTTVRKWRFAPATKDGAPVPVLVAVEMTFTLRGGPRPDPPPMSWPPAFLPTDALAQVTWIPEAIDAEGVSVRLEYPQGWRLRATPGRDHVLGLLSDDQRSFLVVTLPGGVPLPPREALPAEKLQDFFASMKKRTDANKSTETTAVGQIRTKSQLWLWHEAQVRSLDLPFVPADIRDAARERFSGLTMWTFVTALPSQAVTLTCWTMHPSEHDAAAAKQEEQRTGAIFGEVIRRLTIAPR